MNLSKWQRISISLGAILLSLILLLCFNSSVITAVATSVMASGVYTIFYDLFFVEKKSSDVDIWKMTKIYDTRSDKNKDSDPKLSGLKDRLDGVAFGLKTFREREGKQIEDCLRRGVIIRLVTMNPECSNVAQREKEENESNGQIKKTIQDLVAWADELNSKGYEGKITVKGYSCMTLDFYWRMDNELYFGPYWLAESSKNTVTYKFEKGGKGFERYTGYFDRIWSNPELKTLTKNSENK